MKKFIIVIVLITMQYEIILSQQTNTVHQHKISLAIGSSVMGIVTNYWLIGNLVNKTYASPMPQLSYTYKIDKNIGIGPALSYQYFGLDLLPINQQSSGIVMKINRTNLSGHFTFSTNLNKSLTLYAGGRLGLTFWSGNITFEELSNYLSSFSGNIILNSIIGRITKTIQPSNVRFFKTFISYQVLGGTEIYFTDNIGMKFEMAIGSPYWALAGLNYRF